MENFENLNEKDYKEFFEWLLEREVQLEKQLDFTLCNTVNEPYIFYPKEIGEFLQTRPMQRLRKIEQLGTSILKNADASHTRYSHCLGTYHNAVVFYLFQSRNPEWKERVEIEGKKIEVLADIMESLRHDDGHNILSHGLESLIGRRKGTHEIVGARFKEELAETKQALGNIHPDLLEAMKKVSSPEYDLITLREGNLDFDRLDFLSRDSLYLGLSVSRRLSYELLRRSNIIKAPKRGGLQDMVVYDYEALPYIEKFIETRAYLYENMFSSTERKSLDILEEEFCKIFYGSNISAGQRLRDYLQHCSRHSAKNINLEQFLNWNDLKFYNELIDIAINSEDENIRQIAVACLPTREGLCSLAIETLDPRRTDPATYTEEDIAFLDNVKSILKPEHPLHDKLKDDTARDSLVVLKAGKQEEVESVLQSLRKKGITNEEIDAIARWHERIKKYNFNEPIFVKDKNGNIFPLQHHPELSIDLSPIYTCGALLVPAKMRRLGVPEEKIELIKSEFDEFNAQHPVEEIKQERNMRKFQTGEECYVPEYEPKKPEER